MYTLLTTNSPSCVTIVEVAVNPAVVLAAPGIRTKAAGKNVEVVPLRNPPFVIVPDVNVPDGFEPLLASNQSPLAGRQLF
jgi:hypothetical protein